jgi:hypothetical protein
MELASILGQIGQEQLYASPMLDVNKLNDMPNVPLCVSISSIHRGG